MRIYPNQTQDEEFKTLGDAGFTGSFNDRQFSFLRDGGFANSLADMQAEFSRTGGITIPSTGVAWIGGEGQSNMGTLGNTVDQLGAEDVGLFPDQLIFDNTTNSTTPNMPIDLVPYILARTGETFSDVVGPSGERNVGQSDGQPVGPLVGMHIDYRAGDWLDGSGTAIWNFKYSSAGKRVSHFQPFGETASYDVGDTDANRGYQFRCYGYKEARDQLVTLGEPVYRQAFVWAQGEANTNPARDASNTSHVSITSYPTEWQKVYDFRVKQEGTQPPWFIVQLLPVWNIAEASRDVYTDAMNVQLKSLARYTVDMVGGTFNGITDNGSGNANVYYLQHDYTTKLDISSEDPHFTAPQQKQMGQAIVAALKDIHGGNGWTGAYPMSEILPAISGYTVTGGASLVTVEGYLTDPGIVYSVTVPTGSTAPTAAQIIAGAGGAINASASFEVTNTTAGASFSFNVFSVAPGDVDVYTVVQIDSGETSVRESDTVTVTEAILSWDATYRDDLILYSNGDLTAANRPGAGTYAARGNFPVTEGKFYFEMVIEGTSVPPYIGWGHPDLPLGGGVAGTDRVGKTGSNYQQTGGNVASGSAINLGDRYCMAVDVAARLWWMRLEDGVWNNDAGADPATSVGGLSMSGLPLAGVPFAGLGSGDQVRLSMIAGDGTGPNDWAYTPPTGFDPIG